MSSLFSSNNSNSSSHSSLSSLYPNQSSNSPDIAYSNSDHDTPQSLVACIKKYASDIIIELGSGYSESTYQSALEVELQAHQIPFERQPTIPVIYKEKNIGFHRPDLIIDGYLIVELKVISDGKKHVNQNWIHQLERYVRCLTQNNQFRVLNYCKTYMGLLIAFPSQNDLTDPITVLIESSPPRLTASVQNIISPKSDHLMDLRTIAKNNSKESSKTHLTDFQLLNAQNPRENSSCIHIDLVNSK